LKYKEVKKKDKNKSTAGYQWLTPVVLATSEAQIRKLVGTDQFRQNVWEMLFQKRKKERKEKNWVWCHIPVIPFMVGNVK
jgi:hypothetical protein